MDSIMSYLDLILHLDVQLKAIVEAFGITSYFLLFFIIFCETGLVVTPFLPGDSLLFITGSLAGIGLLNIKLLFLMMFIAAALGNITNYHIGYYFGPKILKNYQGKLIKKEYLIKTKQYFNQFGMQVIVISRFMPVIRTIAPFLAGISKMNYKLFHLYNLIGALLWTALLLLGGYFFGNMKAVQNNYSLVILAIVIISFIPAMIEFVRQRKEVI